MYYKLALSLCFIVITGMLTACSPKELLHLKKAESPSHENHKTTSENTPNDHIGAPVVLPPQYGNTPLRPGQVGTKYMPNGLPALSPMKGVNTDTLFAENLKDNGERFNRVENAVVDLRKEFEAYKPSIVRLAAVESDIQNLIKELEIMLQETPTPQQPTSLVKETESAQLEVTQLPPQKAAPAKPVSITNKVLSQPISKPPPLLKPPTEKPKKAPSPVKTYSGDVAQNLRIGEHAGKIRIVIDTNKKFNYSIDIDNDEKLIIVEIPDAKWVGKNSIKFNNRKLLDSYTVESINNGKGTMIIMSLKQTTTILQKSSLTPDKTSPYHRIYFDLKL